MMLERMLPLKGPARRSV
jgi:hypothetical protein